MTLEAALNSIRNLDVLTKGYVSPPHPRAINDAIKLLTFMHSQKLDMPHTVENLYNGGVLMRWEDIPDFGFAVETHPDGVVIAECIDPSRNPDGVWDWEEGESKLQSGDKVEDIFNLIVKWSEERTKKAALV